MNETEPGRHWNGNHFLGASVALACNSLVGYLWSLTTYREYHLVKARFAAALQQEKLHGYYLPRALPPAPWTLSSGVAAAVGLVAMAGFLIAPILAGAAIGRGARLPGAILLLLEVLVLLVLLGA